jgi:hypothetical protein
MPICVILEDREPTPEQSEQVIAYMRSRGPLLPEGARLILAGAADPGWRLITVWDSLDTCELFFAERVAPAYNAVGLSSQRVTRSQFEVRTLIAGDLVGTAQSA